MAAHHFSEQELTAKSRLGGFRLQLRGDCRSFDRHFTLEPIDRLVVPARHEVSVRVRHDQLALVGTSQ